MVEEGIAVRYCLLQGAGRVMVPYASRTGTLRNLAALRHRGWHLLVSAAGEWRSEGFNYAIDNGAFTAFLEYQAGKRAQNLLDLDLFERCIDRMGGKADWILLPDIVGEGEASLALSIEWAPRVRARKGLQNVPLYLAVQDGMEAGELHNRVLEFLLSGAVQGIFVGGSTEWKLSTILFWGKIARRFSLKLHVGRVNTTKRISLCAAAGAHSFDGTSATMFSVNLPKLDGARRQPDMFVGEH